MSPPLATATCPVGNARLSSTQPMPWPALVPGDRLSPIQQCRTGNREARLNRSARPAACCSRTWMCFFSLRLADRRSSFFCRFLGSLGIALSF